jgi:hypothetical protein
VVAGALVGWSLLSLLLAVVLPDAAYAAIWPLLAATAGFGVLVARPRSPRVTFATVTLAAVPAVLLISPLVALYFLLAARFELMLPVATPLPMLWVVLVLTLVVPLALVSLPRVGWRAAAAAAAMAVALAAVGAAGSAGSNEPRPDLLVYHADAVTGTARWVALPPDLDVYTGQVADGGWTPARFEASPFHQPGDTQPAITAPAPALPVDTLPAPQVTLTRDVTTPAGRELTVDVWAPTGSYALTIDLRSRDGIRDISVNGRTVHEAVSGAPGSVRVVAFSPHAHIPVAVTVPAGGDVELALTSYTRGLDSSPAGQLIPRPTTLTTAVHEVPDAVLVSTVTQLRDHGTG